MAVSYVSSGALAYGQTSVAAAYPASAASNDYFVAFIGMKPDTATVATPSGWTLLGEKAGGGGTTGLDQGPTRMIAYGRVAVGGESGTTTFTLTGGNSVWAQVHRFSTPNTTWSIAAATGTDSTTGTAWSAVMNVDLGLITDDLTITGSVVPSDISIPGMFSLEAVAASGVVMGTMVEVSEAASNLGNDIGGFTFYQPVTSGASTGVATVTATATGTTSNVRGNSVLVRLRATGSPNVAPVVTAAADVTNATAGATVTTSATAIDSDGTIVTFEPSSVPALTFSGTGSSRTFTAPAVAVDTTYAITWTATDDDGAIGTDVQSITVLGPTQSYVPPTFISAQSTNYDSGVVSKSITVSVVAGDVVVVTGITENVSLSMATPTATGNTFVAAQIVSSFDYCWAGVWSATAAVTNASLLITMQSVGGTSQNWGADVYVFRNSAGIGVSAKDNNNGLAQLALSSPHSRSAVVFASGDWTAADGSARTYLSANVPPTEQNYYFGTGTYTTYGGYYSDVGTLVAKTIGITTPAIQKYSIVAIEIKGSTEPVVATAADMYDVKPGALVTTLAIASDGDGTIVSLEPVSVPALTFYGSGDSRMFTAPLSLSDIAYVITWTATDNLGNTGTGTQIISVLACTERFAIGGVDAPAILGAGRPVASLVGETTGNTGAGTSFNVPYVSATGNTLILYGNTQGGATISDTAGNAWIEIGDTVDAGATDQRKGQMFYCPDAAAITSVTLTGAISAPWTANLSEWSGVLALRDSGVVSGSSVAPAVDMISGDLIFLANFRFNASGLPEATPINYMGLTPVASSSFVAAGAYRLAPLSETTSPAFGTGNAGRISAVFKKDTGAIPDPVYWRSYYDDDIVQRSGFTQQVQNVDQVRSTQIAVNRTSLERFELHPGDFWHGLSTERSELSGPTLDYDQDIWVSMMFQVYPGNSYATWNVIGQIHGTSGTSPILAQEYENGNFIIKTRHDRAGYVSTVRYTMPLTRGQNYNIVHHLVASRTGNGLLESWIDGVKVVDVIAPIGYNLVGAPYWKHGVYRTESTEIIAVRYANVEVQMGTSLLARVASPLPDPDPTSSSGDVPPSLTYPSSTLYPSATLYPSS